MLHQSQKIKTQYKRLTKKYRPSQILNMNIRGDYR